MFEEKNVKFDKKSLLLGFLIGIGIGSILSIIVLVEPFQTTQQFTVRMKIGVIESRWSSVSRNGITVVFIRDNITIGEYLVGYAWQNATLPKGDYLVKVYEGKSGLFIRQLQIYVAENIEIEIPATSG